TGSPIWEDRMGGRSSPARGGRRLPGCRPRSRPSSTRPSGAGIRRGASPASAGSIAGIIERSPPAGAGSARWGVPTRPRLLSMARLDAGDAAMSQGVLHTNQSSRPPHEKLIGLGPPLRAGYGLAVSQFFEVPPGDMIALGFFT